MANRAGVSKVGLNRVQWVDIDSTVDSVCGTQEGAAKGYNSMFKFLTLEKQQANG
jgi:hypothetical protein